MNFKIFRFYKLLGRKTCIFYTAYRVLKSQIFLTSNFFKNQQILSNICEISWHIHRGAIEGWIRDILCVCEQTLILNTLNLSREKLFLGNTFFYKFSLLMYFIMDITQMHDKLNTSVINILEFMMLLYKVKYMRKKYGKGKSVMIVYKFKWSSSQFRHKPSM